jgi:hypothetical protein
MDLTIYDDAYPQIVFLYLRMTLFTVGPIRGRVVGFDVLIHCSEKRSLLHCFQIVK